MRTMRASAPEFIPGQLSSRQNSKVNHQHAVTTASACIPFGFGDGEEKGSTAPVERRTRNRKKKKSPKHGGKEIHPPRSRISQPQNENIHDEFGNHYLGYDRSVIEKNRNNDRSKNKKNGRRGRRKKKNNQQCATQNNDNNNIESCNKNVTDGNNAKNACHDDRRQKKGHHQPLRNYHENDRCDKNIITSNDTLFNEDCFPILQTDIEVKEKMKSDSETGKNSLWSNVANTGHQSSVAREIEHKLKCEQLQYELDTYTRMEFLSANHYDEKNKEVESDATEVNIPNKDVVDKEFEYTFLKPNYHSGWSTHQANKLKERWLRALQQKKWNEAQEKFNEIENFEHLKKCIVDEECDNDDVDNSLGDSSSTSSSDSTFSSSDESSGSDSSPSTSFTPSTVPTYLESTFPLHFAIMKDDEIATRDLLAYSPAITARDEKVKIRDLRHMSVEDHLALPKALGDDITLSIFYFAILLDRPNILKVLLSNGRKYNLDSITSTLSLNDTNNDLRSTALMIACEYNLHACLKVLMSYGPKMAIRHPLSGDGALHVGTFDSKAMRMY